MTDTASDDNESSEEASSFESLENQLLKFCRNGLNTKVEHLLRSTDDVKLLVNCKGTSKANRDWTPLHLSSYFGHTSTVQILIQNGADVNAINDKGDSALHKAAHTGRLDVVMLLLKNGADVNIVNVEGRTPLLAAKGADIHNLIKAAQETESTLIEKRFLQYASEGNIDGLEQIIKVSKGLNINCIDSHGNSALHLAAYRDQQKMAAFLMQAGVKSDIRNKNGQLAGDVASSQAVKQVLSLQPLSDLRKTVTRFEGVLYKKSRLFGFKHKYVVLDNGVLSVFNSRADASSGARRRVFKYLDDAQCMVQVRDNLGIALVYSDGSTHFFRVEAEDEACRDNIPRQKWINAIRNHIEYSTYYIHKGLNHADSDEFGDLLPLSSMTDALQTAQAHQATLEKEVSSLTTLAGRLRTEITNEGSKEAVNKCNNIAVVSRDMCNVLHHCLTLFTQQEQLRTAQLCEERERCRVLQESLRVLAVQHHELEQQIETSVATHLSDNSMDDSDDEFYDCDVSESIEVNSNRNSLPAASSSDGGNPNNTTDHSRVRSIQQRNWMGRSELPVPMLSRNEFSVWSILKQCIGRELSKITMPVVFNEPISFLQRVTEYMEYAYLLERANICASPEERMAYVAAFAVSACASNWARLGKPFNPLLGETYELNKEELGYKVLCEQVSHHPPITAFHVSAPHYTVSGAINPKLKFWGKSVEITPKGVITVNLLRHGEVYTWENVNCSVHNIIVGTLWVEHHGRMEIVNHKTGQKADITFKKSNMFSREVHRIEGAVLDRSNKKLLSLYGSWTDTMFSVDPKQYELHIKQEKHRSKPSTDQKKLPAESPIVDNNGHSSAQGVPSKCSEFDLHIPGQTFLWQAEERPPNSDKYYSFTRFAMMLNEIEGDISRLCPTDSRLRPDIRCLEQGNIDKAAEKKLYLEEKQRHTRKEMKKNREEWSPRWFGWRNHEHIGKNDWVYLGKYWERNWSNCPDIF